MPDDQLLSRILEALYEAPLDPSRWEEFLRLTAQAAGGHAAAIFLVDSGNASSLVRAQTGLDPTAVRQYEKEYGAGGPWFRACTRSADWIGPSEHFVPFAELQQTEFYNELLAPCEIPHALLAMIERSPSRAVSLSIYRNPRAGAFEEDDLDLIKLLKPHIQRAYRLHTELATARGRSAGLEAALGTLSTGVILLGPRGQIISMNRAAGHLVAANNGLLASGAGLRAEHGGESARLQELIAGTVATATGSGLGSGGAMTISRHDLPPLAVLVSPVRGIDLDEQYPIRAIVFVNDPSQRVRPAGTALRALYGLTPAECRVAMLLADGHAPSKIADIVGVGKNTLKSQLASIYRKTGTSRQSQLVRLLLQIVAPADGRGE